MLPAHERAQSEVALGAERPGRQPAGGLLGDEAGPLGSGVSRTAGTRRCGHRGLHAQEWSPAIYGAFGAERTTSWIDRLPYNPDRAFVTEREEKLYFVRETKSTVDSEKRRTKENQKIACGRKHFATLGVDYDVVTSLAEVAM